MVITVYAGHADQRVMLAFQPACKLTHAPIIRVFFIHLFDANQRRGKQPICSDTCASDPNPGFSPGDPPGFFPCSEDNNEPCAEFFIFPGLLRAATWGLEDETGKALPARKMAERASFAGRANG